MTKRLLLIFALVGAACVANPEQPATDDPNGGKSDDGTSCSSAASGWRAMSSYVPQPGTLPTFARWTADGVWSGREAFFLGSTRFTQAAGCPTPYCWRNEAIAYDPANDSWRTLASPYPVKDRNDLFSRWTGSTWIVFGSYYNSAASRYGMNGRRYDPATDTWTDIPDVPLPQLYKAAVEWSPATEELIVFGGMRLKDGVTTPVDDDSYQASNETWAWALATNTWRRVASSPLSPRMASQAVWDGDAIVFTWGQPYEPFAEESHSTAGAAAYDPVTDTWTMLAEPPVQDRMTFGDHRIGGSHAVFWGGHPALGDGDFWLTLHDGAAWDAAAGDWQVISDFGLPGTYRSELSTWSANGRLYVWGGSNYEDDGTLNNDWPVDGAAWSPATGTWQQLPPAPAPRASAVAVWTGCDAIVYGGNTPMQTTNNSGAILRP